MELRKGLVTKMLVIGWAVCSWSCASDDDYRPIHIYGTWQHLSQDVSEELLSTQIIHFNTDHTYRIVWYFHKPESDEIVGYAAAVSGKFTVLGGELYLLDGTYYAARGNRYVPFDQLQPAEDGIYRFKYTLRMADGGNELTLISNPCNLELGFGCYVHEQTFQRRTR
ncbi:MAG: hypothetical protein JJU34_18015 [Lunatimonas sp.]|uniref:hypothetical protein n=1 Tax=Lunatimonas sp. TaxID=2060141 RepID=UPI00263A6381|nr:hypothetical protein [Lunatimonas sp.]MCC5939181.1 hypothetical protein [Lunatimonas sp.]